ncbi:solute carrier family 25 member 45-like [Lissotriton helveticus]
MVGKKRSTRLQEERFLETIKNKEQEVQKASLESPNNVATLTKQLELLQAEYQGALDKTLTERWKVSNLWHFAYGEKSGALLAWKAKTDRVRNQIKCLKDHMTGDILDTNAKIGLEVSRHMCKLYKEDTPPGWNNIEGFFKETDLPNLSEDEKATLSADITEEEIRQQFRKMARGKAAGPDGLPTEMYLSLLDEVRWQTQSKYRGIFDCIVKTYKAEMVQGFFKGMSFPVLTVAVSNALMFGSYSNALLLLRGQEQGDHRSCQSKTHVFIAGCVSGLVQVYFTAPVDLIKVRLQNQTEPYQRHPATRASQPLYKGPVDCAVSILHNEGPSGLFRGSVALLLRDVPTVGLYFMTYHVLCQRMTKEGQEPGSLTMLFAGGCAGTVSWACANPMDVIKARLQMDGVKGVRYKGVLDCIITSVRQEGASVFLKGITLNSARAFPVNAVTFFSYEMLMKLMC